MTPQARTAGAFVVAATVTTATMFAADVLTGKGFRRRNFHGRSVTLSAGPAVVSGLLAGATVAGGRCAAAGAIAVVGAGAAGAYDDWASSREEERRVKGFAGHLGALRQRRASAGAVKLVVIGASALGCALLSRRRLSVDVVIDGGLVAGSANLANLLDLRPGRTLKTVAAVALLSAPVAPAPLLATVAGAVVAAAPADLGERSMLGDTGANAVGAMVGVLTAGASRRTRCWVLSAVVGLTAVSEKVSFSAVIERQPLLRRLDQLGRVGGLGE